MKVNIPDQWGTRLPRNISDITQPTIYCGLTAIITCNFDDKKVKKQSRTKFIMCVCACRHIVLSLCVE